MSTSRWPTDPTALPDPLDLRALQPPSLRAHARSPVEQALTRNAACLQRRRAQVRRRRDGRVAAWWGMQPAPRVLLVGMCTTALTTVGAAVTVLVRLEDLLALSMLASVVLP